MSNYERYLEAAKDLFALGQLQAAKEKVELALSDSICPDQLLSLYSMYARILELLGQVEEAETYYQKCLELDPRNLKFILRLSDLLSKQGLFQSAIQVLQNALLIHPKNSQLIVLIAEMDEKLGHPTKAIDLLLRCRAEGLKNSQLTYHLACTYFRAGKYQEALENALTFLNFEPESSKAVLLIADIYLALYGYTENGFKMKGFEILTDKAFIPLLYRSLANSGRFLEISLFCGMKIDDFNKIDPNFNSRYDAFLKKGDLDHVVQVIYPFHSQKRNFKKEISWERCREIGNRLLDASRNEEALQILEQGYSLNPADSQLLRYYCEALYRLMRYEEVVERISSYFSRYGENVHFYLKLAKAYARLANYEKAKVFLHMGIRGKPYNQTTLSYAAYFYYRDNDMNMAEYYARECLTVASSENQRASWVLDQIEVARSAIRPEDVEQISQVHMGEHFENNLNKAIHGVFSIQMEILAEIMRNLDSYNYRRIGESFTYRIPYPSAGYEGGFYGDSHILNHIVVITRVNTRNVITAYPIN